MESRNLIIKTLTPVHIGDGNKLGSFEYLIENNKFYKLNIESCFKFIISKRKDALDILNRWAEEKSGELSDNNNNRSKESFKMSIFDFVKSKDYLNDHNLANELLSEIKLGKHIYYSMDCDINTKSVDVSANLKTADNLIYLPGSTIKGIIRTALLKDALYKKLENASYKQLCFNKLRNELNGNNRPKRERFGDFIEQDIFYCGTKQTDKVVYHDEKFDMMKFIHISDSNGLTPSNYAKLTKSQLLTFDKSEVQGQAPYVEVVKKGAEFKSRISIDIDYIKMVHKSKSDKEWIGFEERFNQLFNVKLETLTKLNYDGLGEAIFNQIINSLLNFSNSIVNNEIDWLELSDTKKTMKSKLSYDKFIQDLDNETISVKIGQGLSFINNTLLDVLKEFEKNTLLKILNERNFGIIKKGNVKNIDEFPKSRKLSGNENNIIGLGWVEIILEKGKNG